MRFAGAVALNPTPPTPPSSSASTSPYVIDVTDASLQVEVLERSLTTPVVLDLWATWCGPCKQLSPVLERLAEADAGAWILAKVDVDANPQISEALRVQSIPSVFGVVGGRVLPMFQGALPPEQVRQYLEQLMALAQESGLQPAPEELADGAAVVPVTDPEMDTGDAALEAGDLDAAESAYRALLERRPGDPEALQSIARVALMRRMEQPSPSATDALGTGLRAADVLVLEGRAEEAVAALLALVRSSAGEERDTVRQHLLSIFELFGPEEPLTITGRRRLSAALY
jgi:putative thioredoxin